MVSLLLVSLSSGIRSCLKEGIYGSPYFSEVSAFSQIMEAPRELSASVECQMSSS